MKVIAASMLLLVIAVTSIATADEVLILFRQRFDIEKFLKDLGVTNLSELTESQRSYVNSQLDSGAQLGHVAIDWGQENQSEFGRITGWMPVIPEGTSLSNAENILASRRDSKEASVLPGQFVSDEAWATKGVSDPYTPTFAVSIQMSKKQILEAQQRMKEIAKTGRYQLNAHRPSEANPSGFTKNHFNCVNVIREILGPAAPEIKQWFPAGGSIAAVKQSTQSRTFHWAPDCSSLIDLL